VPEVAYVMSRRQPYPLRELATTLRAELELQAVPGSLHLGGFPRPRPSLVYVLLDPQSYVATEGEEALPAEGILRRTIFVCSEPVPLSGDDEHIALLRRAGAVFVLDRRSVAAMHRLGIPARLITPGYSKPLDRFDPTAPRPIDVVFLGVHSLRRTKYLSRAAPVLSRHNCVLQLCEEIPSADDTSALLAEARWSVLARAKILISIHRNEQPRFDWGGALDAIHSGAVIVTEPSGGMAPLLAGEHLVVSSADSLPYVVEGLLGDEQRLARLRSAAYERLRAWMPYALSVGVVRAAVVELVGEPFPSGAPPGRPHRELHAAVTAVTGAGPDRASEVEPQSLCATRIQVAHESPAWEACRPPLVTVAIAVGDRHDQIIATLDSLASSKLRNFELVLVDRSDRAQHRHGAAEWISAHPEIPSRLVVADASGAGAARNIGVDLARGAFLLILAPGQELYPRCLDVLTRTLEEKPEVAFAYPMQEVKGASDDFLQNGGDYILNYLAWDPQRVRDIHTPVLIRSDSLRQVGGFATNPRVAGVEEDYDLWRRMAERGLRGQLVAQPLARCPEWRPSSTMSVSHP
jgi:Glycosyl transferase family 2